MTAIIAVAAAKSGRPIFANRRRLGVAVIVLAPAIMFFSHCALADEGGVSFWIPDYNDPVPDARTAEEREIVAMLERIKGRKLTEQEINLSLDQARALGEL